MLRENPQPRRKSLIGPTYKVTIIMLVIGQIQVSVAMEMWVVIRGRASTAFW